jgi:dephospho-CoA kinase
MTMITAGVTGGIGSGKSIVCRLFAMLGGHVYDSDLRARELMSTDAGLIGAIREAFGAKAYRGTEPDRDYIAGVVFNDKGALARLNSIVHPAVMRDFRRTASELEAAGAPYAIMESAVILENNLQEELDYVVTVSAPAELRIERAMARDGASREKIEARMANQMTDTERERLADFAIYNDGNTSVWEQVLHLDGFFRTGKR